MAEFQWRAKYLYMWTSLRGQFLATTFTVSFLSIIHDAYYIAITFGPAEWNC